VAWRHSPLRATVSPPQESSASPAVETEEEPGQNEKALFRCDPSCAMWEDFQRQETPDAVANLQAAASTVAKYMPGPFDGLGGADALSYWAKHAARTGYFLTNALAGTAAHSVEQRRSAGGSDGGLGYGGFAGMGIDPAVASRLVLEAVLTYEQDWQRIRDGAYSPPWDMEVGHRQSTLPFALRQSARFVQEAVGTLARRTRGTPEDRTIWLDSSTKLYPDYYKTNFHYQTDGWMSARSAAVYETSTETLFLGRQDAMQRASLVPLQGLKPLDGRKAPRVLEVACGTGRFATFLRDNHPTAELTCVGACYPSPAGAPAPLRSPPLPSAPLRCPSLKLRPPPTPPVQTSRRSTWRRQKRMMSTGGASRAVARVAPPRPRMPRRPSCRPRPRRCRSKTSASMRSSASTSFMRCQRRRGLRRPRRWRACSPLEALWC
jgi:hypothetical protein